LASSGAQPCPSRPARCDAPRPLGAVIPTMALDSDQCTFPARRLLFDDPKAYSGQYR
jgi:hypothetical protein